MSESIPKPPWNRQRILVEGIVQGVGFRPFVYQLASGLGLAGWVCNDTAGVSIEIEGPPQATAQFLATLQQSPPPLARMTSVVCTVIPVTGESGFAIRPSCAAEGVRIQIAPDSFVCGDCLSELFDPADRRFHYPFINCTNCGPRYTIVTGIPYDRPLTTMAEFPMCDTCLAEYASPASRRFHAQPNACPTCGPRLSLVDAAGKVRSRKAPLVAAIQALRQGQVVAVKGLGGYHLAVDAANSAAVNELRRRKRRDEKPFALMVGDLAAARCLARVTSLEARLLEGPERPIVLVEKRAGHGLAEQVAPDNRYYGVMLPSTPLHYLLLERHFRALVMTSANLSDEPIAYQDEDALRRLSGVADLFLMHNRPIQTRTDDSIARVMAGQPLLLRRSRGYVPRAVRVPLAQPSVLAVGAELKNTICLTRGDQAFLSQHIGDLKNVEVSTSFVRTIDHLRRILEIDPVRIACDLHPDYESSRYAREQSDLPLCTVQHHHAHLASCLAEHGCREPAIGVIFDGFGFGSDGHAWGGEFLLGDLCGFERAGHFAYQSMPGGDLAIREPWRMALSYLLAAYGDIPPDCPALAGVDPASWRLVEQAVAKGINCPLTSSCGRLFDGVAALLGLRQRVCYEGQAAMALEMVAEPGQTATYPCPIETQDGQFLIDTRPLIRALYEEQRAGVPVGRISSRFHQTLASLTATVCNELRHRTGLSRVVLSGGVFQNRLLTELTLTRLEKSNFTVLRHSLVPPNDAGLALGQAVIAGHL